MPHQDHDPNRPEIFASLTSSSLCISDSRDHNQVARNETRNQHVLTVAPLSINSPLLLKHELRPLNHEQGTQNFSEVSPQTGKWQYGNY